MVSPIEFKKKYPRQYKWLIEYYSNKSKIFDISAAIQLYLRGSNNPVCDVCGECVSITKKFRNVVLDKIRCHKHTNTNSIIEKEKVINACDEIYTMIELPDKPLTKTDQVKINCKYHGPYIVNLGNFLSGMKCQRCYHDSRIGKKRGPMTPATRRKMSAAKTGKKINLSEHAKNIKQTKQKQAWARRKENQEQFAVYLENLSLSRKKYLAKHGHVWPPKERTKLEDRFEKFLVENKVGYQSQYILDGKKFDFYLTDLLLLVEIDGEYWHRMKSSIKNDIEKHQICLKNGLVLVRISSDDFYPEIIFKTKEEQDMHTKKILLKRGIDGY